MGNSASGWRSEEEEKDESRGSRRSRLKKKIFKRRSSHGSSNRSNKGEKKFFTADDFYGIVRFQLVQADMQFRDKWFACFSLGQQTFRSATSDQTEKPVWKSEIKVALEANGPSIARISVFETNRLRKNNLVGYCEIDLSDIFNIDYNDDGKLSLAEFSDLIKAFGNKMASHKLEEIFKKADIDGDGVVDSEELVNLLTNHEGKEILINNCPVCGEELGLSDNLNDMIHVSLCFDEGTGNQIMTGGFLTEKQASYGWMFKISEWAHFSTYDVGLKSGSAASHILVFDRRTKRLVEEVIQRKIVMSLRAIYQSKLGLTLIDKGTKDLLQSISNKQGERMNTRDSAKDIPKFIDFFEDRINVDEFRYPIEHFKTFNEFFIRELKPGCRPVAYEDNDHVAVCGADSRLMAFMSQDYSKRFWIKGKKFSVRGLLGDEMYSEKFDEGALVIFRLAPQDYHRFHMPISGVVGRFNEIPGQLYTVNPIAVNSKYCNVFTENKRVVCIISSQEFGKMAFVAIGATMVGSITFTKNEGDFLKKGDELGYFSFGGSTVVCVFEKDAIDLDEDLVLNSERSLETLVSVGMSLGVSKKMSEEQVANTVRPRRNDSIAILDNEVAERGIRATTSGKVINYQIGLPEEV
ncbi:phosphatidylserine decarboxylase proenzyme 3 isoform X3 [Cryptomeria japonica]|uniref:phosphatidylserine decarboxylase proenzyme 3 isoform X3 n=1 Tax=Cryptomeria japonica TaxID=3369 RepID=UPI0027D9FE51|nr:phosphatidylserine decarboxylase proenzyme 3 isoform X3 [Cryptomeria japonica]